LAQVRQAVQISRQQGLKGQESPGDCIRFTGLILVQNARMSTEDQY
jgi:hypothetical protein